MISTMVTSIKLKPATNVARRDILYPTDQIQRAKRTTMMKVLTRTRIKYVKIYLNKLEAE